MIRNSYDFFAVTLISLVFFSSATSGSSFWTSSWRRASFAPQRRAAQPPFTIRGGSSSSSNDSDNDNAGASANLGPVVETPEHWATDRPKQGLILIDSFCPYFGLYLSSQAKKLYGVATIMVLSEYMKGYFAQEQPDEWQNWLPMVLPVDLKAWLSRMPCEEIVAVHCESDSGLSDGEHLAVATNAKYQNGPNEARRDKFLMNLVVGTYGLPVVKQKLCRTLNETLEYATELFQSCMEDQQQDASSAKYNWDTGILGKGTNIPEQKVRCIVKPIRGVASENVHLCHDLDSVKKAFDDIQGSSVFGAWERHQVVLVQEFAAGTEYAVDIVSRNGEHKVAALWRYDKRFANGAPFCYFATELIDVTRSEVGAVVCDYARKSLDALNVKWGISHTEIIVTANGPRLVEVNCRQHNMDFAPLTMFCIGYNAFDMLLAAYLGGQPEHTYPPDTEDERLDWDTLPDNPSLRAFGAMVHIVNFANGTLTTAQMHLLDEIHNMESVLELEVYPEFLSAGEVIKPTMDIRSDAGWVQLINDDPEALRGDYDRIVELMPQLFQVAEEDTQLRQNTTSSNAADPVR